MKPIFLLFSFYSYFIPVFFCLTGAIFHEDNYESEIAFKYSVERINMFEKSFELVPLIHHISPIDSFKAERVGESKLWSFSATKITNFQHFVFHNILACELLSEGVAAIFGPGYGSNGSQKFTS